jgi:hypothetical protein
MHTRRAGHLVTRPLNCGVMRHRSLIACLIACIAIEAVAQSYGLGFPSDGRFVLPKDSASALLQQCSRPAPQGASGYWEPSRSEIEALEVKLVAYLESLSGVETPPRGIAYHRQYVGFVLGGTKLIYGNFYPGERAIEAERLRPALVCDGGSAHWGIVYDPATSRFSDLAFNGVT